MASNANKVQCYIQQVGRQGGIVFNTAQLLRFLCACTQ